MSSTTINETDLRWGVREAAEHSPSASAVLSPMSPMSPLTEEVSFLRLVDNCLVIDINIGNDIGTAEDAPPPRTRTRARRETVRVEPYPLDEAYVSTPPIVEEEPIESVPTAPRRVIAFARAGEGAITPELRATARVSHFDAHVDASFVAEQSSVSISPPVAVHSPKVRVETIDPRMSARRADVVEGRRRSRYRSVASVLVAATLLGGAVVAVLASPLLQLRTVRVHGGTEIGVDRVRSAAGLRLGQSMLDVNVDQVRRLVTELPLVERVTVRRQWPRTVVLDVVEAVPVAAVAMGDTWSVVDRRGTVLETRPVQPSLPSIELETGASVGPVQPGDARIRGALAVASLMSAELRQKVARVAVRGTEVNVWVRRRGAAKLRRGPGDELLVLVGDPRDLDAKVRALDTMLAGADLADAAVLDLTVPDQPIVTPRISTP